MSTSLHRHHHFSGNADELAQLAHTCAQDLGLHLPQDKANERLVRYYVAEGVLDKPERQGRDAAYGFRQLLQLLTARRMTEAGITLATVAGHNQTATTKALEAALHRPLPTAAELLVGQFIGRAGAPLAASTGTARKSHSPRLNPPPTPAPALADVLDEIRALRAEMAQRMDALSAALEHVNAQLNLPPNHLPNLPPNPPQKAPSPPPPTSPSTPAPRTRQPRTGDPQ